MSEEVSQHGCPDLTLQQTFYLALDKVTRSVVDNGEWHNHGPNIPGMPNGKTMDLTFLEAGVILDKVF